LGSWKKPLALLSYQCFFSCFFCCCCFSCCCCCCSLSCCYCSLSCFCSSCYFYSSSARVTALVTATATVAAALISVTAAAAAAWLHQRLVFLLFPLLCRSPFRPLLYVCLNSVMLLQWLNVLGYVNKEKYITQLYIDIMDWIIKSIAFSSEF